MTFFSQNLTRCKLPSSKPDRLWKSQVKIWHGKTFQSKLDTSCTFSFKDWHFVYFVFQELTRCGHPNSESGTWWYIQVKNWQVVKFSFQDLTRCKTLNLESDKLRFFPWNFRHDVNCFFFQNYAFENHEWGKICPFSWTKKSTWTFDRNFFHNPTLFEVFNSKSDSFWFQSIKIRHFVKTLIQNLTR